MSCRHVFIRGNPEVERSMCVLEDDHVEHWDGMQHWRTGEKGNIRVPGLVGAGTDDALDTLIPWRDGLRDEVYSIWDAEADGDQG